MRQRGAFFFLVLLAVALQACGDDGKSTGPGILGTPLDQSFERHTRFDCSAIPPCFATVVSAASECAAGLEFTSPGTTTCEAPGFRAIVSDWDYPYTIDIYDDSGANPVQCAKYHVTAVTGTFAANNGAPFSYTGTLREAFHYHDGTYEQVALQTYDTGHVEISCGDDDYISDEETLAGCFDQLRVPAILGSTTTLTVVVGAMGAEGGTPVFTCSK